MGGNEAYIYLAKYDIWTYLKLVKILMQRYVDTLITFIRQKTTNFDLILSYKLLFDFDSMLSNFEQRTVCPKIKLGEITNHCYLDPQVVCKPACS